MAGVHPSLLPGGRAFGLAEERAEVEAVWGPIIVGDEGRSWWGILEACAARDVDVLFLIGVDPLRDYPDAALATRALQNVDHTVVQSLELGSLEPLRRRVPSGGGVPGEGRTRHHVGRAQPADPADPRRGQGIALPDWEIFASLALAAGGDLGFETLDELHEEMGRLLAPRASRERAVAGTGPSPLQIPEGSLHLFTYPLLVDEGRLSERADELKAALEDEAFLEMHPSDATTRCRRRRWPGDGPNRRRTRRSCPCA